MADETYRKFHSGRFGPASVDIEFSTQISGTDGVDGGSSPSKKKGEPEGKDKMGNTYKNQAIADDFDAQEALMKM